MAQKRCVAALPPRPLDPSTPLAFVPTVLKLWIQQVYLHASAPRCTGAVSHIQSGFFDDEDPSLKEFLGKSNFLRTYPRSCRCCWSGLTLRSSIGEETDENLATVAKMFDMLLIGGNTISCQILCRLSSKQVGFDMIGTMSQNLLWSYYSWPTPASEKRNTT